jgi:hypothetical protein
MLERKGIITSGIRAISDISQVRSEQVCVSIRNLIQFGHLERNEQCGKGRRQNYKLLPVLFENRRKPRAYSSKPAGLSREVNKSRLSACSPDRDELARILAS